MNKYEIVSLYLDEDFLNFLKELKDNNILTSQEEEHFATMYLNDNEDNTIKIIVLDLLKITNEDILNYEMEVSKNE